MERFIVESIEFFNFICDNLKSSMERFIEGEHKMYLQLIN